MICKSWISLLCCIVYLGCISPAQAVTCSDIVYQNTPYTICEVLASEDIRMFLHAPDGEILGGFNAVAASLGSASLPFATNGGMYHSDRRPVGYYVENQMIYANLSDGGGYGNFGLLPNGIFCINDRLQVWSSESFADASPVCHFATQSGPMLVIDGALHPAFLADSSSRYIRNGVGTAGDGSRAVFAISNRPVTFHQFGRLFRDYLGLANALFLDGNVSRLHAPSLGRSDGGWQMGPIIGVVD